MKKLSFKEYLESKRKLRETVEATSHCKTTYNITKYCRLVIGEKDEKEVLSLKPNQRITVEWFYPSKNNSPEPSKIIFEDVEEINEESFSTYWSGDKLLKWLKKNAIQKFD